jgi:hypothetical protein
MTLKGRPAKARFALCHAQRPHFAKGFCRACYYSARRFAGSPGWNARTRARMEDTQHDLCALCRRSKPLQPYRVSAQDEVVALICGGCRKLVHQVAAYVSTPAIGTAWLSRLVHLWPDELPPRVRSRPQDEDGDDDQDQSGYCHVGTAPEAPRRRAPVAEGSDEHRRLGYWIDAEGVLHA